MSININGNEYIFEEEELEDIEYLEIMSIDDIIKDNPSFIALSSDEIKSSLFELFANKKKANNITTLFYDIINDIDGDRGKLKNYDNYVFDADAEKRDYSDGIVDKAEVANFNNLKKKTVINHDIAKEKYFFCIKYNNDSEKLRFKPEAKINITIEPRDKNFPIYYPVFPADDVNIPIISAYYKIPKTVINDYLYTKITSHLTRTKNINYVSSENCENVRDLIKGVKPDINNIIEYLKDSFELDYYNIENVLNKFGKSLDFINKEDFSVLCDYLADVMGQYKERKNLSRPVKIKKPDIINKKLIFFDKLNTSIQLLNLSEKVIDFLDKNKMSLEDYRENNIMTGKIEPLKKLNTYDIVDTIRTMGIGNSDDNAVILEILDIITRSLKNSNILEAIESIDGILKTHEKKEIIVKKYEIARNENEYSRNHIFDYDKDGKQYVISYREHKEIKDSHYNDKNEGIPMTEFETQDAIDDANAANAGEGTGDIGGPEGPEGLEDIGYIIGYNELSSRDIDKYITNINYKNELGFIDSLENMLNILNNIGKSANIEFDYDALCSELFKYNRSISKRRDMYIKAFQDNNLEISEEMLNYLDKLSPKSILALINNRDKPFSDIDDNVENVIVSYNKIWSDEFNDMFLNALAYCIINLQDKILNDTIFIDVDYLNGNFLSYWDNCGSPLNKKEDRGVMSYIIEVAADYLITNSNNEFLIQTDNMFKRTYKVIEKYYSENLERMKKKDDICREKKKEQKGKIEKDKLRSLLKNKECGKEPRLCREQYIQSLIYMPDVNYVKIHKFLNGCCLKKLDDSFNEDIDLKNADRLELIAFKKKYAEKKMTNKPRDLRFIPKKTAKAAEAAKTAEAADVDDVDDVYSDADDAGAGAEEIIERIYLKDEIYDMNNNSKIVRRWLEEMKGKNNSVFPDNIIADFENGNIKSIKNSIIYNVSLLTKTSKHSGDDFIEKFNNVRKTGKGGKGGKEASNDKIKYLNIIRAIIKTLYGYLRAKDNNEEIKVLLTNSINDLRDIIIDLKELNKIYNDDIENEIDIINKYIVSRALCCPFNINNTLNGKIISDIISSQYIENITKSVYYDVFKIISITFPTLEENIDFLNKQREKNKQEKINAFNKITVEENALIKELKKAGFKQAILEEKKREEIEINNHIDNVIVPGEGADYAYNAEDAINNFNEIHNDNAGGAAKQEMNDENMLMTYDREDDDENMDTEEMGFLYNYTDRKEK
jgi:hypothetical protein